MIKFYVLIIILNVFIINSCCDCDSGRDCKNNEDCIGYEGVPPYCNLDKNKCMQNLCFNRVCGAGGTCVQSQGSYSCQCDENSLPYDYFQDSSTPLICTPKCETHADCREAYVNLGHQIAGACIKGQCNERNECEEDSDCPKTDICGHGMCGRKPIGG